MNSIVYRGLSHLRRRWGPRGQIDAFTSLRAVGWAFARYPVRVEAWLNGRCIAQCTPDEIRRDVAAAYPKMQNALASGFSISLPVDLATENLVTDLRIIARDARGWRPTTTLGQFMLLNEGARDALNDAPDSGILGPFPPEIINAVATRWGEDCNDLFSPEGQGRFVRRLHQLMTIPGVESLPIFSNYARYLSTTLAHCHFVARYFPATNFSAANGAADFHCKPNSVREIFSIIHQLYVLKSWGVTGDFAEFGCFKGYSSAMLSFACQQLGLRMHIFDSFEGLPPAEGSGYEAGQYAGGLEEVRGNVTRFGAIEAVEFHKGFFAETFRNWSPPALMCLWMDVDLEASSRDLMVVADRLDPRASLFSHECTPDVFCGGEIIASPEPANPVPPMVDRHIELGRPLTGRFITGFTGAFWPRDGGIPVMDNAVLMELARGI